MSPAAAILSLASGNISTDKQAWYFWLGTRVALLLMWAMLLFTLGDTRYYWESMLAQQFFGPTQTMVEYPTPVLWFFDVLFTLSFGQRWLFVVWFVVTMLSLDTAFSLMLFRYSSHVRHRALYFWSLFGLITGPTFFLRFDLATAILAAISLILVATQLPAVAGAITGLGAALKLWPALLWPSLMIRGRRTSLRATLGFWGAGIALALVSLLYAGWDRLVSPLTWQSERGLQVESIWATPAMLARLSNPDGYEVAISEFNAYEIAGPGTELLQYLSSTATVAGLILIIWVYVRWLRGVDRTAPRAGVLMLFVISTMIVTNKIFSPQYLMWLAAPMAAIFPVVVLSRAANRLAHHNDDAESVDALAAGSDAVRTSTSVAPTSALGATPKSGDASPSTGNAHRGSPDTPSVENAARLPLTVRTNGSDSMPLGDAADYVRNYPTWMLWIALLTTVIYPFGYPPLVHDTFGITPITLVLLVRNVMIVWLWWRIVRHTWLITTT